MSPAQKRLRDLRERQSKERQRMAELGMAESLDDETRAELDRIETGTPDLERQLRAAAVAVEDEDRASTIETGTRTADAEQRERIELRSRASVGRYLTAALRGRAPDGAEAELQQAAGVDGIPFELWNRPPEQRQTEDRAITAAPSTVGVNLDVLRPFVFAPVRRVAPHGGHAGSTERHFRKRHDQHGRDGRRRAQGRQRHGRRRAGIGRRIHRHYEHAAPDRRQPQSVPGGYRGRGATEL